MVKNIKKSKIDYFFPYQNIRKRTNLRKFNIKKVFLVASRINLNNILIV